MATSYAKRGHGSRMPRENANGFPVRTLDDNSAAGLEQTKESEAFGLGWDAGFSACISWMEKRRMNGPMNEPLPPQNPVRKTKEKRNA
ncbi:MAG TPA: hypothetical protein VF681_09615 [Abditibacteriaceae bacterium]|jgi:hypothetical protein